MVLLIEKLTKCSVQRRYYSAYKKIISWYSGLVQPKPQEIPFKHIVQIGDPVLRNASEAVPLNLIASAEINFLIDRMTTVFKKYHCVGLSAPQIGIPVNIIMFEFNNQHAKSFSKEARKSKGMELVPLTVVINPELKVTDYTKITFPESCESIKGFYADVPRFLGVELKGYNKEGGDYKVQAKGWLARIIQHEMDHLSGKLYTDAMDRKTLTCSCWTVINERGGKVELPYGPQ